MAEDRVMEDDRVSYTYSEKIGGANFSSKSISVSYTSTTGENESLGSCWDRVTGFVHERFVEQKIAHARAEVPLPDPANYNDPRNYAPQPPEAPMPQQQIAPQQPFPTPGPIQNYPPPPQAPGLSFKLHIVPPGYCTNRPQIEYF